MIHYHGTPFSGPKEARLSLQGKHAFVSFARPDDIEIVAEVCQSFALDNGAFTAWKQGEKYDLDAYLDWAGKWMRHPGCDWALIPDMIDGSEMENDRLLWMFSSLQNWVPVWHLHESLGRLAQLARTWSRVALGSSGRFHLVGAPEWWSRMAKALDVVTDGEGRPICKLHGLRMLDPVVFSHIPFSSADSTNVGRNIGFDERWRGPYMPQSRRIRAMLLMERIESHATAHRWNRESRGVAQNRGLFG